MTLVFLLGVLLGIRHAMEPDHVTSILALCTHNHSLSSSMKVSLYWGAGHTATLAVLSLMIIGFKIEINQNIHNVFEIIVGCLLIIMGVNILANNKRRKFHIIDRLGVVSKVNDFGSLNLKALGLGLIHGCAGSGIIIVFTLTEFASIDQGLVYMLVFSFSLLLAISIIPLLLHLPIFRTSNDRPKTEIKNIIGIVSVVYGVSMIYNFTSIHISN